MTLIKGCSKRYSEKIFAYCKIPESVDNFVFGDDIMTGKELMYVEDALGHEQYIQTQCCESAQNIQDRELREFAQEIEQTHRSIFNNFYHLL